MCLACVVSLVLVNNSEVAVVAAGVTEVAVKAPAQTVPKKKDPWTTGREAASLWTGDIDGKKKKEKKALSLLLKCLTVEPHTCGVMLLNFLTCHEADNTQ